MSASCCAPDFNVLLVQLHSTLKRDGLNGKTAKTCDILSRAMECSRDCHKVKGECLLNKTDECPYRGGIH